MRKVGVGVPTLFNGRVVLGGITEPKRTLSTHVHILAYKAGDVAENIVKMEVLDSTAHRLELRNNLAQIMCRCLIIAAVQGWDVEELVDDGWDYIGERFKDFEKNWEWKEG